MVMSPLCQTAISKPGHIAYRTDDLESFKAHLKENSIPFSDWGETAVAGWQQIFFYDPDGNIIEVHQVTT